MSALVGLICTSVSTSCGPLPLSPAYIEQRLICGEQAEVFEELLADCRERWLADGSCAGVLGFSGELEGTPVIVESELLIARFKHLETIEGPLVREDLLLTGRSPYFEYTVSLKDIGGGFEAGAPPVVLEVSDATVTPEEAFDDGLVEAGLRLATGSESIDFSAQGGELATLEQLEDEHVASFVFEFESGDRIEGCFHALVSETLQEQEVEGAP